MLILDSSLLYRLNLFDEERVSLYRQSLIEANFPSAD